MLNMERVEEIIPCPLLKNCVSMQKAGPSKELKYIV
jgi:hypothetical protein